MEGISDKRKSAAVRHQVGDAWILATVWRSYEDRPVVITNVAGVSNSDLILNADIHLVRGRMALILLRWKGFQRKFPSLVLPILHN